MALAAQHCSLDLLVLNRRALAVIDKGAHMIHGEPIEKLQAFKPCGS